MPCLGFYALFGLQENLRAETPNVFCRIGLRTISLLVLEGCRKLLVLAGTSHSHTYKDLPEVDLPYYAVLGVESLPEALDRPLMEVFEAPLLQKLRFVCYQSDRAVAVVVLQREVLSTPDRRGEWLCLSYGACLLAFSVVPESKRRPQQGDVSRWSQIVSLNAKTPCFYT